MEYDPLKDKVERYISLFPVLRMLFYKAMDLCLLRQHYVKKEIEAWFPNTSGAGFYDAGAGFCQYSWHVLHYWPEARVFATDLKTDYLKSFANSLSTRHKRRFGFKSADLQSYVPSHKYDMAIAIDIMEHIEDDLAVLKNFHEALVPGGMLIISTPSDTDEAAKFTSEHVRPGYNKQELEAKLQKSGFTIEKSIYSYGKYGRLAWKLLIKAPLNLRQKKLILVLPLYLLLIMPLAMLLMKLDMKVKNASGTGIIVVARNS